MAREIHPQTDRELLARIRRSAGGKAGYKQLVRELGLGGGRERRLLLEQLARIVARGELSRLGDEQWAIPTPPTSAETSGQARLSVKGNPESGSRRSVLSLDPWRADQRSGRDRLISGQLEIHRDGYGFVRPRSGGGSAAPSTREQQDIFVPPGGLHGAMHGDLVLVDEDPAARDGRRSGRVSRVLTRRNPTIVGLFHVRSHERGHGRTHERDWSSTSLRGNFVQPLDERLGGPVEIPDGLEMPPAVSMSLNRTIGTPEMPPEEQGVNEKVSTRLFNVSRSAAGRKGELPLEGLAVEVEITSFPQAGRPAQGRVIEILGPPDAFGVDVEIVIRKHAIPHMFPAHVLEEANVRSLDTVANLVRDELTSRHDFRTHNTVTIDGESARDFDDGVSVQDLPNGNTELQVHIADVGWYVLPGSALDTEARVRGTSVYFPDRAVPMLPHALSSGICSLLPDQDRLVLSCVMEVDASGEIARFRVGEGIIRSTRRMTYTGVQRCLNASPSAPKWNEHGQITSAPSAEDQLERNRLDLEQPGLPELFDRMLELALRLNRKRKRRGSIDFDLPEPVVEFDPDGNMKAIVRSERGWAHRLIEEFMLSANECVATWLTAQGVPSIYRIHEMPDPKRILDFEETAATFGQTLGIGALPVKRMTMKSDRRDSQRRSARGGTARAAPVHDLPERIPVTPQMYQRLVRRIQGTPEERILSYLMLRSLKQARYAEKNEGHFALASPCYTHFTSPIRRYPDLIVHRLLRTLLRRGADPEGGPILSTDRQPWSTAADSPRHHAHPGEGISAPEPISAEELADIALESSQAERRAADAERELIEWKKMKFMADKIGDDFRGIILSVTKFGFFVELDEMFVEGLVPLGSLLGDFYSFRDADRTICGARTGHCFRVGDRVEVLLDRIDRQQRRLQFALVPGTEPKGSTGAGPLRTRKDHAGNARPQGAGSGKAKKSAAKQRKRKK